MKFEKMKGIKLTLVLKVFLISIMIKSSIKKTMHACESVREIIRLMTHQTYQILKVKQVDKTRTFNQYRPIGISQYYQLDQPISVSRGFGFSFLFISIEHSVSKQ